VRRARQRRVVARHVPPASVDAAKLVEPLFLIAVGVVAIAAGAVLPPLAGVVVTLCAIALSWGAALGLSLSGDRLLDPLTPSAAAALVFVAASVTAYAGTRAREALVRKAKQAAEKVRRWGDVVELEPLNAFDRRIIHQALKDDPHIETHSVEVEGTEKKAILLRPKR